MQTLPPIGFGQAFKLGCQNYCKFTGRARRSEFFYFFLAYYLILMFLFIIFTVPFQDNGTYEDNEDDSFFLFIPFTFMIAAFCPMLGLMVRRLHDIGYSGFYVLIGIIPFGCFFLLYLWCIDSDMNTNIFGPSPKYIMPATTPTNYNPPAVVAVTPVVQPAVVLMPVQPTIVVQPVAPYPQPNPTPVVPYPQQNPMAPPVSQYPPPADPYSKPNPIQPQNDTGYNSTDFSGQ